MPNLKANQRRRRLRLIKTLDDIAAKQFRSAVSALTIASDTESARLDGEAIRETLLIECRVNRSSVLRIEHPGAAPLNVAMDRPYLLIGSDPACDVRLEHEEIRPRHVFLQWIDGHLFCSDIGPNSGYFPRYDSQSNGRWIDHEPVQIGPYQFSLVGIEPEPNPDFMPLDRSAELAAELPYLALHFDGVEQSDNVWPINRMLTIIGRGPQCKLRLNHQSMAYVQAALLRTPTGCWLIDVANDGKTCVNGRAIQVSPIDIGDEVQFGGFMVEVVTLGIPSVVPSTNANRAAEKRGVDVDSPLASIKINRLATTPFDELDESSAAPSHLLMDVEATETAASAAATATAIAEMPSLEDDFAEAAPVTCAALPVGGSAAPAVTIPTIVVEALATELLVTEAVAIESVTTEAVAIAPVAIEPVLPELVTIAPTASAEVEALEMQVAEAVTVDAIEAPCERTPVRRMVAPDERQLSEVAKKWREDLSKFIAQNSTPKPAATVAVSLNSVEDAKPTQITESKSSAVVEPANAAIELTKTVTPDVIPDAEKHEIDSTAESMISFLRQQQDELDSLKHQLNEFKKIYDAAAGQLISKKLRDSLEKPVIETMQRHDAMQEKLAEFLHKIEK